MKTISILLTGLSLMILLSACADKTRQIPNKSPCACYDLIKVS